MRRALFFLFIVACSSDVTVDDIAPMDGGVFDSTTQKDVAPFGDTGPADVAPDVTKFNGGGPFLCEGCVCDGTLNLCLLGGGGGGMPIAQDASFGDAAACDPDAGQTFCQQIPVACLPKPTCECIQPLVGCACSVDPSGNGFVLQCPPKP